MRERWKAARWGRWNRPETICLQGVIAGASHKVWCEIPNYKIQITNKSQIPNSKTPNGNSSFVDFGLWILGIVWNLVLGHWNFYIVLCVMHPWWRAYWRMSQRVDAYCKAKPCQGGAVGKPSVNSALVVFIRPEARWAYHEQDEPRRNAGGGPNDRAVQYSSMTCGKEW